MIHDILPIFTSCLWMFGPQYDSVEYRANRGIATVLRELLGGGSVDKKIKDRADIVAIDTGAILPYSLDGFEADAEVGRLASVLLLELKKGAHTVSSADMRQTEKYIRHLKKGGHVSSTEITAYVLGWSIGDDAEEKSLGSQDPKPRLKPCTYNDVIRKAQGRMFRLVERIRKIEQHETKPDPVIREVIRNNPLVFNIS